MSKFVEWSDIDRTFRKTKSGEIAVVTGEDAINQSIKNILSIMRGEKVRSDMGSSLYAVLFEPMSIDSVEEIQSIVDTNIRRYEDRVILTSVRVIPMFDEHYYKLSIDYRIKPTKAKKNLTTFLPAMGEL